MSGRRLALPPALTAHPLAAAGAAISTLGALLLVLLLTVEAVGWLDNPYLGLLTFVLLPALFVVGLFLVPAGLWLARRRVRLGKAPLTWPTLDLADARVRSWLLLAAVATIFNTLLVAATSVEAIHYMDSPRFCGQVCHTPMAPHFVQWQRGPAHTKVACIGCHIGTGAEGFLVAKSRGAAQLLHMVTGAYPRPVPTPIAHRPPAGQTCGQCHEARRWLGERRRLFTYIADDQASTPTHTRMTLLVGGSRPDGPSSGIHWHASPDIEIDYIATDESRDTIPWVRVKNASGQVKEFVVEGFDPRRTGGARRRMDCVDCHNKVAHPFAASAERVVDRAFVEGRLDARLPYLRREAVRLLKVRYGTQEQARTALAAGLEQFYAGEGASAGPVDRALVTAASGVLADLHGAYVFPAMRVTFGTYLGNGGHTDAAGCFRCHDDKHTASDGSRISQDCLSCHRDEDIDPASQ